MMKDQFSTDCQCNDYYELTAKTGLATISQGNKSMSGVSSTTVFTAGTGGAVIKSIIAKATQPIHTGMLRFFLRKGNNTSIIHEIAVPATPKLKSTPTPMPLLPTFVHYFPCNFFLDAGDVLTASTLNSESFNIIVEALDISYPNPVPSTCCNFMQTFPETGVNTITAANSNLDGTGTILPIYNAASPGFNGSTIRSISISALDSTLKGMVRLFLSPDGVNYFLFNEIYIPDSVSSPILPTYSAFIRQRYNIQSGYVIGASTENSESFGIAVQGVKWLYA